MLKSVYSLIGFAGIAVLAAAGASYVQRGFGEVTVSNVTYTNKAGTEIRAKLFRQNDISSSRKAPGIVYVHGYQNNRETSDPFCIETARREMVTLCIDAIGRGNSGFPADVGSPAFDKTYGVAASVAYLRGLPFVDPHRIGIMGNSLGGELAYEEALADPSIRAVAFSGFAPDARAGRRVPRNLLMMFGAHDEYRRRMLGTNTEKEWLALDMVKNLTGSPHPQADTTYGSFEDGDARRIKFPPGSHLAVSHSFLPVAAAVNWMRDALLPAPDRHPDGADQIWPAKEWGCLLTMLFAFACLFPLVSLLCETRLFSAVAIPMPVYTASKHELVLRIAVNTVLMWLYLPLVMILYAVHIFVIHIDGVFPMMITNGIVFWFFMINIIGLLLFRRWRLKSGYSRSSLGLAFTDKKRHPLRKTALLAAILFAFSYALEYLIEHFFIIDYRFLFPFASDLTPERALLWLRYFPFVLVGFWGTGVLLHVQLKRPERETFFKTFLDWSAFNTLVVLSPLIFLIALQYVPVYLWDFVPLVGPGGAFVSFIMNLIHIVGVLLICVPLSTWCYLKTKTPILGAFLNAALVTWMFASSQVVAPIPL